VILVTGATGHTGRRLVQRLVELGRPVRILTRDPAKLPIQLRRKIEVFRASIDETARVADALSGCKAVIALTHIKFAPQIVAAMHAASVHHAIFMSSTRRFTRFPEETARQVIVGEEAVRTSGLDYTIIRPSMIYGGRQDNNLEHLVASLRRWPVHPLVAGGKMKWQPVFTWDVVQALVEALDRPETIGREYTIAGPEPITYREMVRTILREAKLRRLLFPIPFGLAKAAVNLVHRFSATPRIRPDQIDRLREDKIFDISDARRDLGFNPIPFADGIRRKLEGTA
jgi:uncharacterized protein YbjT (DUF2867 family)